MEVVVSAKGHAIIADLLASSERRGDYLLRSLSFNFVNYSHFVNTVAR